MLEGWPWRQPDWGLTGGGGAVVRSGGTHIRECSGWTLPATWCLCTRYAAVECRQGGPPQHGQLKRTLAALERRNCGERTEQCASMRRRLACSIWGAQTARPDVGMVSRLLLAHGTAETGQGRSATRQEAATAEAGRRDAMTGEKAYRCTSPPCSHTNTHYTDASTRRCSDAAMRLFVREATLRNAGAEFCRAEPSKKTANSRTGAATRAELRHRHAVLARGLLQPAKRVI